MMEEIAQRANELVANLYRWEWQLNSDDHEIRLYSAMAIMNAKDELEELEKKLISGLSVEGKARYLTGQNELGAQHYVK